LVLLILLAVTISIVTIGRDVKTDFWLQAGVNSSLLNTYNGVYSYKDMTDVEDYNLFVKNIIASLFFQGENIKTSTFGEKYYMAGPVVFRQVRTKQTDCAEDSWFEDESYIACYYDKYNSNSKETDDIEGGLEPWNMFQDAGETGISGSVSYR
jgi:hypothetical protein